MVEKRSLQSLIDGDLDHALDFIAERAVAGRIRRVQLEKQAAGEGFGQQLSDTLSNANTSLNTNLGQYADTLRWGFGGALAGGALGGLSTAFQKKKRPLSSVLSGALMGGAVGAGSNLVYKAAPQLFGDNLSKNEHDRILKDVQQEKLHRTQMNEASMNNPGLTDAAKRMQLEDRDLYDLVEGVRQYGKAGYDPTINLILRKNIQRVVGQTKGPDGKSVPVWQSWGNTREDIQKALESEVNKPEIQNAVERNPFTNRITSWPSTTASMWHNANTLSDYAQAAKTTDIIGLKQPFSGGTSLYGKSEGALRDIQRLWGGGPSITPEVQSLFGDIVDPKTGSTKWGFTPTEAAMAIHHGPQAREELWQSLKQRPRYEEVEGADGKPVLQSVPWKDTPEDRQKFDDLLKQVEIKGGMSQMPGNAPTFHNSYWDMMAATGGSDVLGTYGRRWWWDKRTTDPRWLTKALSSGKFSNMPELEGALNKVMQTEGPAGLKRVLQQSQGHLGMGSSTVPKIGDVYYPRWYGGQPFKYNGMTVDPERLEAMRSQVGATNLTQPTIKDLEDYLADQRGRLTGAKTGPASISETQANLLERELGKLKTQPVQDQQTLLKQWTGTGANSGLAGAPSYSSQFFDTTLGDVARASGKGYIGDRNSLYENLRGLKDPTIQVDNRAALQELDAELSGMPQAARQTYIKGVMDDVQEQLRTLPGKAGKGGPSPLIRVPVPGSQKTLYLDRQSAERLLGKQLDAPTFSGPELARAAGGGLPRIAGAVPLSEIVEMARQGKPIPGLDPKQQELFQRMANTVNPATKRTVLEEALAEIEGTGGKPGVARTFGETVTPGSTIRNAVRATVEEAERPGFWRGGWAGTPVPRPLAYMVPATAAELLARWSDKPLDEQRLIQESSTGRPLMRDPAVR
jgi:hypothetical protein